MRYFVFGLLFILYVVNGMGEVLRPAIGDAKTEMCKIKTGIADPIVDIRNKFVKEPNGQNFKDYIQLIAGILQSDLQFRSVRANRYLFTLRNSSVVNLVDDYEMLLKSDQKNFETDIADIKRMLLEIWN